MTGDDLINLSFCVVTVDLGLALSFSSAVISGLRNKWIELVSFFCAFRVIFILKKDLP